MQDIKYKSKRIPTRQRAFRLIALSRKKLIFDQYRIILSELHHQYLSPCQHLYHSPCITKIFTLFCSCIFVIINLALHHCSGLSQCHLWFSPHSTAALRCNNARQVCLFMQSSLFFSLPCLSHIGSSAYWELSTYITILPETHLSTISSDEEGLSHLGCLLVGCYGFMGQTSG